MKLLFIFTGGTIGSTAKGDIIAPDAAKPYLLCEKYVERYPMDFTFDTLEPLSELSENFSGEHISLILKTVSDSVNRGGYDGIVVTHGTDTLQYTAAALGYALGNETIPVCLVSSNFPIEDRRSNGLENLFGAMSLIKAKTERGVFVPYRNGESEEILFHRATRLSASLPFSDDLFAVRMPAYGKALADGTFEKNADYREKPDELPPPLSLSLPRQAEEILRIFPFPGMVYPKITSGVRAILLDTYHSGTVDSKSPASRAFFAQAKEMGIPIYATGDRGGSEYESTHIYDEFGVLRLPRLAPIAAYMKIWLYRRQEDLQKCLLSSRGGDIF